MVRRDIFAVKNGKTYERMTLDRRRAKNYASVTRDMNYRLGLTAEVKIVHPGEEAVRLYAAANNGIDK